MDVALSLHPLERKVLPFVVVSKTVEEICKTASLQHAEVVRAVQWLASKKLVSLKEKTDFVLALSDKGSRIKELPEKTISRLVASKAVSLAEISHIEGGDAALGILRQRGLIVIKDSMVSSVGKTENFFPEEQFLKKLPFSPSSDEDKSIALSLKRRGLVREDSKTIVTVLISDEGRKVLKKGFGELVDSLTVQMIKDGSWKGKNFRAYDIKSIVPRLFGGKFQPYKRFLDRVRQQFIALGFKEMSGPLVESDFWDMDALFMPQFHSARDIHEAYYVRNAAPAKVESAVMKRVKEAHEKGIMGSRGWQYKFDPEMSCRHLLRTQGTACSARMLASPHLEVPGKYFAIARCFRYDVIDTTHLPDFNQVEGFVVDKALGLKHLFGLLQDFAKNFANAEDIRIVPGYFPFTEPSAELFAKHPSMGWIELGGAGLFRPEVIGSLAQKDVRAIAWGLGVDRLGMFNLGMSDIRDLFSRDLSYLRNARVI
ncbi:phenylalanine--tRNA ligase subunit alpha [Candidatus Woesearchaeota archaeon]|nr:phenylalanine--tRNA ligase subunit alpha [Candidatus Woesearchaeota archaeon]